MNVQNTAHQPTLEERLRAGRFVMTAEVAPPVSCDAQDLLAKALPLRGLADAVNLTDGAGARAHMGALASASILFGAGIEPILQFTCRDRNRIALQSDLMGAAALGIRNLLVLTGDDPKAGDQPDTKPVFDIDSRAADRHRAAPARPRRTADRPQGRGQGGLLPRRRRYADRPAGGLAAEGARRQGRRRRPVRADAVLHGCGAVAPLRRRARRRRPDAGELKMLIGVNPLRSAKSAAWMKTNLFGTIIPGRDGRPAWRGPRIPAARASRSVSS